MSSLCLRTTKYVFMWPQVTYLIHNVTKENIQTIEDKVPILQHQENVSELKLDIDKLVSEAPKCTLEPLQIFLQKDFLKSSKPTMVQSWLAMCTNVVQEQFWLRAFSCLCVAGSFALNQKQFPLGTFHWYVYDRHVTLIADHKLLGPLLSENKATFKVVASRNRC